MVTRDECAHVYPPGYCYADDCPYADRAMRPATDAPYVAAERKRVSALGAKARSNRGKMLAQSPPVRAVLERVCAATGATTDDLTGSSRHAEVVVSRFLAALRLHDDLGLAYTAIGEVLCRDHTTVISAVKRARGLRVSDPLFSAAYAASAATAVPSE